AILIWIKGENPLKLAREVFGYALGTRAGIASTLRWASPVIITGLGVAIAFRVGIGNIGVEGQLYVAALVTALLGYSLPFLGSPLVLKGVAILGGTVAAALYALVPAFLLVKWRVNEILSTMMLNYVAIWGTEYIVRTFFMESTAVVPRLIATREILPEARLGQLIPPYDLNTSLIIGVVLCILFYLMYRYTSLGYMLNTLGGNKRFARYGGLNVTALTFLVFALSGAVGGLGGSAEILGIHRKFINGFSAGIGWDGLLVSLIAKHNPLGIIPAGLFWGLLKNSGFIVERISSVNRWTIYVLQAVIVLLITADLYVRPFLRKEAVMRETGTV
ncbi:MAG: ABC transporter permease, partial [Candidatus Jordarchaeaceae archaeon]